MFAVVAILAWSVVLGLSVKRFGLLEEALLVAGILTAIVLQYVVFGPS